MNNNCAICGSVLLVGEPLGRCKRCGAYFCEECHADYCAMCSPLVRNWDPNVLGRVKDSFTVTADGHFWFSTPDYPTVERSTQRLTDFEIWAHRERGCELVIRVRPGKRARLAA